MTTKCRRCDGCGQIADSESGEPWTSWAELPPGSDLAVRMGIVSPIPCPECGGGKSLGQIAFEAYNESKGGLTYDGKPIPPWSDVGDAVRAGWRAAARAVAHVAYDIAREEADDQRDEGGTARRVQRLVFERADRPEAWLADAGEAQS